MGKDDPKIGDSMKDGNIPVGVVAGDGKPMFVADKGSFARTDKLDADGHAREPDGGGLTFEQLKAAADAEPGRSTFERDFENLKRALENLPDHSKNPPKPRGPS